MKCGFCKEKQDTKLTAKGNERLPRGWKKHDERTYCATCWCERYVLRAITIPVVKPLGESWADFRIAIKSMWAETTKAINWMITEMYTRDIRREEGVEKMPKMPKIYLYPETRKLFPSIPCEVCSSLENATKAKYMRRRYEVIWVGKQSLPNARYPQPAIAPARSWKATYETAGREGGDLVPCVNVRLADGKRWLLQLRGGRDFARQLRDFKLLASGECRKGEMAIIQQTADRSRNGVAGRDSGGQKTTSRVMIKMVGWFPKKNIERKGVFFVSSTADALVVGLDEKNKRLWSIHAGHIQRRMSEHDRRLKGIAEDRKIGLGATRSLLDKITARHANRMKTSRDQIVAAIIQRANRGRYSQVRWVPPETDHHRWQWAAFEDSLRVKCEANGITYERMETHAEVAN